MKIFGVLLAIFAVALQAHGQGTCVAPNCVDPTQRPVLWAHSNSNWFYQCIAEFGQWVPAVMACQCGTLFDAANQRCELPGNWSSTCQATNPTPTPTPCDDIPATTTEYYIPTVPVQVPTAPVAYPYRYRSYHKATSDDKISRQ